VDEGVQGQYSLLADLDLAAAGIRRARDRGLVLDLHLAVRAHQRAYERVLVTHLTLLASRVPKNVPRNRAIRSNVGCVQLRDELVLVHRVVAVVDTDHEDRIREAVTIQRNRRSLAGIPPIRLEDVEPVNRSRQRQVAILGHLHVADILRVTHQSLDRRLYRVGVALSIQAVGNQLVRSGRVVSAAVVFDQRERRRHFRDQGGRVRHHAALTRSDDPAASSHTVSGQDLATLHKLDALGTGLVFGRYQITRMRRIFADLQAVAADVTDEDRRAVALSLGVHVGGATNGHPGAQALEDSFDSARAGTRRAGLTDRADVTVFAGQTFVTSQTIRRLAIAGPALLDITSAAAAVAIAGVAVITNFAARDGTVAADGQSRRGGRRRGGSRS
jgi:hypothetical protein